MHPANSNYEIHLNSGRKIVLEEIHQHLTYAGLLEGLPNQRINDGIISELKNIVSDKIYGHTTPYIIKPNQGVIKLSDERMAYYESRGPEYKPVRFPKIICICHFNSESITDDFMFSALSIVWFQEDWMMPIDKSVLDKIKRMEWDKHAVQGDY